MKSYLLKLWPPRPDFMPTMSDAERNLMRMHIEYWSGLLAQGMVVAFGPVADPKGTYGVALAHLDDGVGPEAITGEDPVMVAKAGFRYEIYPMPQFMFKT
jgi:hypothetical protein